MPREPPGFPTSHNGSNMREIADVIPMAYLPGYDMELALAMVAGLITSIMLETCILKFKNNFDIKNALFTAFNMSFASMIAMELSENAMDYILTGGGNVPLNEIRYWLALAASTIAGFLVPFPYNYYKLKKLGKSCH